jgi:outer membrane protein assembly factor BamB
VLRSVSRQTGITTWSAALAAAPLNTLGVIDGGVFSVSSNGVVAGFTVDKGAPFLTAGIGANVTAGPQFNEGSLVVGTDRKDVITVDVVTGRITTIARSAGLPTAVFVEASGRILVGDDRGNITFNSADGRRVWKFRNGARISAVVRYDSEFLATSHDNFLYKISRGGSVEWKRRLSGRIAAEPAILGDLALVATVGDGSVYAIDLSNGKIGNRIESGEESSVQVVAGKDGFAIVAATKLSYFGRHGCAKNEKTAPAPTPS